MSTQSGFKSVQQETSTLVTLISDDIDWSSFPELKEINLLWMWHICCLGLTLLIKNSLVIFIKKESLKLWRAPNSTAVSFTLNTSALDTSLRVSVSKGPLRNVWETGSLLLPQNGGHAYILGLQRYNNFNVYWGMRPDSCRTMCCCSSTVLNSTVIV